MSQVKTVNMVRVAHGSDLHVGAHRSRVILLLISVVAGGLTGWSLAFAGLGLWGLALGAAVVVAVISVFARRSVHRQRLTFLVAYALALVLLTWPLLWLAVGYVRYVITGESLGE